MTIFPYVSYYLLLLPFPPSPLILARKATRNNTRLYKKKTSPPLLVWQKEKRVETIADSIFLNTLY